MLTRYFLSSRSRPWPRAGRARLLDHGPAPPQRAHGRVIENSALALGLDAATLADRADDRARSPAARRCRGRSRRRRGWRRRPAPARPRPPGRTTARPSVSRSRPRSAAGLVRTPPPRPVGGVEDAGQDVRERAEVGRPRRRRRRRRRRTGCRRRTRAAAVVALALLGIAEDVVGLGDLLEALLGAGLLVRVRVVLAGELAVRLLDVLLGGLLVDPEDLVVVAWRAIGRLSTPPPRRARAAAPRR